MRCAHPDGSDSTMTHGGHGAAAALAQLRSLEWRCIGHPVSARSAHPPAIGASTLRRSASGRGTALPLPIDFGASPRPRGVGPHMLGTSVSVEAIGLPRRRNEASKCSWTFSIVGDSTNSYPGRDCYCGLQICRWFLLRWSKSD